MQGEKAEGTSPTPLDDGHSSNGSADPVSMRGIVKRFGSLTAVDGVEVSTEWKRAMNLVIPDSTKSSMTTSAVCSPD